MLNLVLSHMIKWFIANNSVLKLEKAKYNEIYNKEFITFYITYWLQRKVDRQNREYKIPFFTN